MGLVRRFLACASLAKPGAKSFVCQALLGALLIVLFWVADAAIDISVYGKGSFTHFLFEPDSHELADFSLIVFLVVCLLLFSRRSHRIQAGLEEALQDALGKAEMEKSKLEAIMDAMGDAVSIQNRDLVVLYQNRAHREISGGSHLGRYCYEAYRGESAPCPNCHLKQAFADGKVHRVELSPPWTRNGRFIEVTSSVVPRPGGLPEIGIEVIRDTTSRKLAEREAVVLNATLKRQAEELQQVNRELEAFCLAISHDLRAPLTRIYSSAQELQGYQEVLDENGRFFVKLMNDGCVQLESMIEALMVLCRVTEVELASAPVDLSSLVEELVLLQQHDHPDRKVRLDIEPGIVVRGDSQLLRIAMENLVSNAWKYTSAVPEPVIKLAARNGEDGERIIFLRDNGAGFDPSRGDELFKPFKRLHTSRQFPGTGLGLATVRRIIRRMNGQVWAEGRPGEGATFYFTVNG